MLRFRFHLKNTLVTSGRGFATTYRNNAHSGGALEIAGYETVKAWARSLGLGEVADLFEETLNEEKQADEKTHLAEDVLKPNCKAHRSRGRGHSRRVPGRWGSSQAERSCEIQNGNGAAPCQLEGSRAGAWGMASGFIRRSGIRFSAGALRPYRVRNAQGLADCHVQFCPMGLIE